jgi:hypothetical protein
MNIKITVALLKEFLKHHPNEELEDQTTYQADHRIVPISIDQLSKEELDTLVEVAGEDDNLGFAILKKINTFKNIAKNPGGRVCKRLEDLAMAMKEFLKDAPNHWLFEEGRDDSFSPSFIEDIEYHEYDTRNETPAHVTLQLGFMHRGDRRSQTHTWHRGDLVGGKTVGALLLDSKLYMPTEKMLKAYEVSMERYKLLQPQTGAQFTAKGEGMEVGHSWHRSSTRTSMVQEGVPDKLVMDDMHEEGEAYSTDSPVIHDSFWSKPGDEGGNSLILPTHPYVKLFNLDRHSFAVLHVDQLFEYKWSTKLGDKLILPHAHKEVIQILMETASEEIDDIIKGKSGGTICICTGEPGTGKTLTAEVTSEVIKRPLYKVNCSQLGTDEEAIEKELQLVLTRATRWMALLLIDEADVYVRARENDIQQNAIVGVFLRVLEYYRGVLFLTSNRAVVIDDAIMSRATVHLKYERPDKRALEKIWAILSKQFNVYLDSDMIVKLVQTFPGIVGRDVKSLLKLVVRYSRRDPKKVTLDLFKMMAIHKDIEVVK